MRILLIKILSALFLIPLLWCGQCLAGQRALVVYNIKYKLTKEVYEAFAKRCPVKTEKLYTVDMSVKEVHEEIKKRAPDIIISLGVGALEKVKDIGGPPVVYALVETPHVFVEERKNIYGVDYQARPEKKLAELTAVAPDVKCVGVFFTEDTRVMARELKAVLDRANIRLISKNVGEKRKKSIPALLEEIKGPIDVFWMLPINEISKRSGFRRLRSFSEGNYKILTYADRFVEKGAFISVHVDFVRVGERAAEIAGKILAGEKIDSTRPHPVGKSYTTINLDVVKSCDLEIPSDVLQGRNVYPTSFFNW